MEYIYLLETRESVRLGDQIYKIGKSKQEAFKRFDQYPTGSILITYEMCFDCDKIEKQLIKIFNTKYKNTSIYGKEYFHGNLADMRADIFNCINQEYREVTEKSKNANIISNLKTVNSFDELVKQQGKETITETKKAIINEPVDKIDVDTETNYENYNDKLKLLQKQVNNSANTQNNITIPTLPELSKKQKKKIISSGLSTLSYLSETPILNNKSNDANELRNKLLIETLCQLEILVGDSIFNTKEKKEYNEIIEQIKYSLILNEKIKKHYENIYLMSSSNKNIIQETWSKI